MESYPTQLDVLLFQHDRIEPDEVHTSLATEARCLPDSGPLLLMRAVLKDAVLCAQGQAPDVARHCRARVAAEARAWIVSRDLGYLFSFEAICDALGIDADRLRHRLLRLLPSSGGSVRSGVERSDLVRRLRLARMRGNIRTQVVVARRRRGRGALAACHALTAPGGR